ncbi:MAG: hypothetical protein ABSA47_08635 [Verrucomicrobiota bacterium]|jgi:hypothetical protein
MRERPVSVTIFGILNIGFGALGLLSLGMQNAEESFAAKSPLPWLNRVLGLLSDMYHDPTYVLWRDISVPLRALAGVALLAAGIGLLRRKNWARLASIGYGVYAILFVLANLLVMVLVLGGPVRESLRNDPALLVILGGVLLVAGLLISLAYPALLIFFMTRPKILPAFAPPAPPAPPPP